MEVTEVREKRKKQSQWKDIWKRFCKNRAAMLGLFVLGILIFSAIFADFITPEDLDAQDLNRTFLSPNLNNLMGTDNLGRDMFSRIIYGARTSLRIGFTCVGVALTLGVIIGSISGYYGGILDNIFMRMIDILIAVPNILLAIAIASALGPGLTNTMIAVGVGSIPGYARQTRAAVLSIREREFIEAARAIGGNDFRIITRHILPNCMAPIMVEATLGLGNAILSAAALSFIGLGIQPPTPEWGYMLSVGRRYIRDYAHMVTFPGLAIVTVVVALNMVGDGLRDALDPKLKK
jgi:peptide/nickel transport system permease protein